MSGGSSITAFTTRGAFPLGIQNHRGSWMSDQGPHSEDLSGIIILRNKCFNFIFFPLTRRTKVSVSWHHPIKNHNEDLSGNMSSLLLSLCAVVEIWLWNMIYATAILEWQNFHWKVNCILLNWWVEVVQYIHWAVGNELCSHSKFVLWCPGDKWKGVSFDGSRTVTARLPSVWGAWKVRFKPHYYLLIISLMIAKHTVLVGTKNAELNSKHCFWTKLVSASWTRG